MSDYTPITQGLRENLKTARLWLSEQMAEELLSDCDNIDALHKSLENENEKLRKELKERPNTIDFELMTAFVDCLRDAAEHHEDITLCGVDYTPLHQPTVADVLREFADGIKNQNADFTELIIKEYTKRLQLAEGDDDE